MPRSAPNDALTAVGERAAGAARADLRAAGALDDASVAEADLAAGVVGARRRPDLALVAPRKVPLPVQSGERTRSTSAIWISAIVQSTLTGPRSTSISISPPNVAVRPDSIPSSHVQRSAPVPPEEPSTGAQGSAWVEHDRAWALDSRGEPYPLRFSEGALAVSVDPSGDGIAVSDRNGLVTLYSAAGLYRARYRAHARNAYGLAWDGANRRIVTAGGAGELTLRSTATR